MNRKIDDRTRDAVEMAARIYRAITQDSIDGFSIVDMKGNYLDINNAYCTMVGYDREELLKMNVAHIDDKKDLKYIQKHFQKIKKTGSDHFVTQFKKKNGEIIDVDISANYADYLDEFIFVFVREMAHEIMAKNIIEEQLLQSHKHLGVINRKIKILYEIGKIAQVTGVKKYKQDLIDHILHVATRISHASQGCFYSAQKGGKYKIMSCYGISCKNKDQITEITTRSVGLIKYLIEKKELIKGDTQIYKVDRLIVDGKIKYFITLPLMKKNKLAGFIFLGFENKKDIHAQDYDYLEVFATHASYALITAGIF